MPTNVGGVPHRSLIASAYPELTSAPRTPNFFDVDERINFLITRKYCCVVKKLPPALTPFVRSDAVGAILAETIGFPDR